MKQRNKMQIPDMTLEYWIVFKEKNIYKKDLENELRNDGKTSNDGDSSTRFTTNVKSIWNYL